MTQSEYLHTHYSDISDRTVTKEKLWSDELIGFCYRLMRGRTSGEETRAQNVYAESKLMDPSHA